MDKVINFYEQQPLKIQTVAIIATLGVTQLVVGCLSIAVPNFGTTMISEGVGDIIMAIKGAYSRNISM